MSTDVPVVLLVDGRPCTFVDNALARDDVRVVLLRFASVVHELPESYLSRTAHVPTFVVDDDHLTEEAGRYQSWVAALDSPPTYFCNPQEPLQEVSQSFAGLLGLPHLAEEQVAWVRRKPAMKERYAEIGVPSAAYRMITSLEEVTEFAGEWGWPVVLKPVDSFACIGTYRIEGPEHLAGIPPLDPERRWMVEEFVRGTEFQLCALVHDGKVIDAYLSLNPAPILTVLDGAINANITFAPGEETPLDAKAVCQQLVEGLKIDHGYFHGECFLTQEGTFRMGEVAARISGCEVPANHGMAYGFDIQRAILDTYLGREPMLDYTQDRAVGDLLLPIKPGRIVKLTTREELLRLPGVMDVRLKFGLGDVATPPRASYASVGYAHVEGPTAADVEARMRHILANFEIETEQILP